jgi:hypothetical protein
MKIDHLLLKLTLCSVMSYFVLVSSAHATGNPPNLVIQAMGAVMSRGVLSDPLRENTYQSKITVSSVTNNNTDSSCANCTGSGAFTNDMKGDGFTAALTYGFSNHWGASILAGYTSISGTRTLSLRDDSGALIITPPARMGTNANVNGADGSGKGYVATVNAIWDFWEGDQFRLPVYFGAGIMSVSEQADSTLYGVKRTADFVSSTLLVGIAPTITTDNFSTSFFFMVVNALNPGSGTINDYRLNTRADFALAGGLESAFPIAGIEFTYRPWNLGFSYSPDITREGAKSIGFKWSTEWGGKSK